MKNMPLSKELFSTLVVYLIKINIYQRCKHKLFYTRRFLKKHGLNTNDINEICAFFQEHGGYCDCEVLLNVIHEIFSNEKEFNEYISKAQAAVNK